MTNRERILSAMRGEAVDRIPWAPRMDLWYISNRAKGTLPEGFDGLNMVEIAKKLNVACHAVRADFTLPRPPEKYLWLRGFGLDMHPDYPFRIEIDDLPVKFEQMSEQYTTTIETSAGEVTSQVEHTAEMIRNGISLPFIKSYPIQSLEDLDAVGEVFDHLKVNPTPEAYTMFHQRVGDQGVAVAAGLYGASPMHLLLHDMMDMQLFFEYYFHHRDALNRLTRRMAPFFEAVLDVVIQTDAEVVYWGSNYDQNITWPPFFAEEIVPWMQKVSKKVHAAGKLLLTHTDGENKALLPHYLDCNFDVAESVCPYPMTSCTLHQIREALRPKIATWGGIPAVALVESTMDQNEFNVYLDEVFRKLGTGAGLIFGVSDAVAPDSDISRFDIIKRKIDEFGSV
jgi:uroporphyrinogen-III decarboxylase